MAALMSKVDIAIGAGGVSLWERSSMGLPSLTVAVNDNQRPGVNLAKSAGAIWSLTLAEAKRPKILERAIQQVFCKQKQWINMGNAGRQLINGKGAEKIVA